MISDALMSKLAQRGASSMMGKGMEVTGDKDFEETSKPRTVAPSHSVELIEESSGKVEPEVPVRVTRRRSGKEIVDDTPVVHKKIRLVKKSSGGEVLKPHQGLVEPEKSAEDEVYSIAKTASVAKDRLDQFILEFDRLVALSARGCAEAELAHLRLDAADAVRLKGEAERRLASLAKKHDDSAKLVSKLQEQVEELSTDKESLNSLVASFHSMEADHRAAVAKLNLEHTAVLEELKQEKRVLEEELAEVRDALEKSSTEAFKALESGYNLCWNRVSEAGLDVSAHTFDHHCADVARSRGGDACSAKGAGSAS
ncbi:uncharacterized protein LOC135149144 [Daucus carota subsp. sativus]|uniref:uncharacterized protein LOC135149144 n=1 Tax=Daucus carota subsp. sativus TaxID=79200 RepID=UPI0030834275